MNENDSGGWSDMLGSSRKFHYFDRNQRGERSLCGKWALMAAAPMHPDDGRSPDDCAACRRKLDSRS